jgi:hypothetical protein
MSERTKQVMYVPASFAAGHHVAVGQRWEVSAIEGDTGEVELTEAATTERVEFIRRPVIALAASDAPSPEAAWAAAQRTWDAKPEDC